jgi:hypothetical protein
MLSDKLFELTYDPSTIAASLGLYLSFLSKRPLILQPPPIILYTSNLFSVVVRYGIVHTLANKRAPVLCDTAVEVSLFLQEHISTSRLQPSFVPTMPFLRAGTSTYRTHQRLRPLVDHTPYPAASERSEHPAYGTTCKCCHTHDHYRIQPERHDAQAFQILTRENTCPNERRT